MDVYAATILIIAVWAASDSAAFGSNLQSSCYEFDVSWVNGALEDFKFPVNDASQCQKFCKDSTNCTSWTWTTEDNHQIKSACFLFSKTGNQSHWPETVSGPRSCSCSKNEACSATKENVIRVEVIDNEETCKDFCYNTTGCSFYTWYDSSDFLPPICILLSECTVTFSSCTNCFSGPPKCKTEQQEELAIIVTGGFNAAGMATSVDLLFNNGSYFCGLPNLPDDRRSHSQNGFVTCGGWYTKKSCLTFVDGEWQQTHHPLLDERYDFSSWETSNGGIYLIGGGGSILTSEVIDADGNTESGFDLTEYGLQTCLIEDNDEDRAILTGGIFIHQNKVSVFDKNGFVEQLPDLLTNRGAHACGIFINNDNNKVLLVAGGEGDSGLHASTETFIIGTASWQTAGSLPNNVRHLKGVSISNKIFLTGGYSYSSSDGREEYIDSVLEFNQDTRDWKLVGHLSEPRSYHGASVVPLNEASKYCLPSNQMEKKKKLKSQGQS